MSGLRVQYLYQPCSKGNPQLFFVSAHLPMVSHNHKDPKICVHHQCLLSYTFGLHMGLHELILFMGMKKNSFNHD